jgi:alcohol dehydrogenase
VQYPIGAMTHTPHGAGVAVMMPYVMEFNRRHCEPELAEIGQAMGLATTGTIADRAGAAIDAVETLFASVGIPKTIADLGIVRSQLGTVAEQAMGSARLIKNNPRPIELASMATQVEAAFAGSRAAMREAAH